MRSAVAVAIVCLSLGGCGSSPDNATTPSTKEASALTEEQRNAEFWKGLADIRFTEDRSHAGDPLPDARLIDADGRPTSLAALRGKPLLINFWAHWCVPCRAEMPTIDRMVEARGAALQVVAVNEDARQPGSKSLGPLAMHPRIVRLTDEKGALAQTLAKEGLPTTVLYGSDGRERWRLTGVLDWTKSQARKLLEEPA